MHSLLNTGIGRLRLIAFIEGLSLLLLLFVAVPAKYLWGHKLLVGIVGPVHGAMVLLYLFNVFSSAVEHRWKFTLITWKIICASLVPFGTFYIDRKLFRPLYLTRIAGERQPD